MFLAFLISFQEGAGNIAISGTVDMPGWEKNRDGEQIAGFTLIKENGDKEYVVRPDPLSSAGADCKLRPNWRLAVCSTKYGNVNILFIYLPQFDMFTMYIRTFEI